MCGGTAGYLLSSGGHNLYKFIMDQHRNNITAWHVIKILCDLDSMDIKYIHPHRHIPVAIQLMNTLTAASYVPTPKALSSFFFSFIGLEVQLFVFLCGQMELLQYSIHVRSPENLLLLPERGTHWASGLSLPGRGQRETWGSKAYEVMPMAPELSGQTTTWAIPCQESVRRDMYAPAILQHGKSLHILYAATVWKQMEIQACCALNPCRQIDTVYVRNLYLWWKMQFS